jgi:anti-sigma B factor antagonist
MAEAPSKSVFLVDPYSDPVIVRIEGRASFQNCGGLREFVAQMIHGGKLRYVFDFMHCTSMDSTFLGVLAGMAIDLRKRDPKSSLVLARLGKRNLELVRNLGLHRLLTVDSNEVSINVEKCDTALAGGVKSELENARLVLEAHENLVSANEANRAKFQDVLVFMKNRVEQG